MVLVIVNVYIGRWLIRIVFVSRVMVLKIFELLWMLLLSSMVILLSSVLCIVGKDLSVEGMSFKVWLLWFDMMMLFVL